MWIREGSHVSVCQHGMNSAYCARCKHDPHAARVAVMRPVDTARDARWVDPYVTRTVRPIVGREIHSLVPSDDTNVLTGLRAVIARVKLDLTYAVDKPRKDGSMRSVPITKGRAYRMADNAGHVTIRCPRCEVRMTLGEAIVVAPYMVTLPRIESCIACQGADDDARMRCRACDGRGWVVLGQDYVSLDLACQACVVELRSAGGYRSAQYTVPNRSGEPGNPKRGSGGGSGGASPMCKGCQMRSANKRSGLCSECEKRPLYDGQLALRRVNRRISEIEHVAPPKDA